MTFPAAVVQLLLSSPSDLPSEHRESVIRAIRTWNNSNGRRIGVIYSPTNWQEGSSPEYGRGPQDVLNEQLVDSSDICLAIFTDRLGTATDSHRSGTVEEIERIHGQGKRVAILVNRTPRSPAASVAQAAEAQALAQYLEDIRHTALYREYRELAQLNEIVNNVLNDAAFDFEAPVRVAAAGEGGNGTSAYGIWPSCTHERRAEADSKGVMKNRTDHRLVLDNRTGQPAHDISVRLVDEADAELDVRFMSSTSIRILAPGATYSFSYLAHMGIAEGAMCIVEWSTPEGEVNETRATVALI